MRKTVQTGFGGGKYYVNNQANPKTFVGDGYLQLFRKVGRRKPYPISIKFPEHIWKYVVYDIFPYNYCPRHGRQIRLEKDIIKYLISLDKKEIDGIHLMCIMKGRI